MTAFLRRSVLSAGGLSLSLRDEDGQLRDAEYVVWTVSSAHDGRRASGLRMKAVRRGVGQYYAPWYADDPTGAFEIEWEWRRGVHFPVEKAKERFFVMDLDDPTQREHVRNLPPPGGHVFEPGQRISGREIVLRLTGASGCPKDAFGVTWSIECASGRVLVPQTSAVRLSTGEYGIDWIVSANGGELLVRWRWAESVGGPLSAGVDRFQVVNPKSPKAGVVSVGTDG